MTSQEKMNQVYSQYALPAGTMVQEYRVIETLGIGNFGIVYAAKNKYFSEIVAIKEFLPTFLACRSEGEQSVHPLSSDTEKAYKWSRHKFLQEAKTLRTLGHPAQHPNIVRVIQFIEANGTGYMVMDLENGHALKSILEERGPLNEEETTAIRDALLDGLERVHGAGVWHRDIKPSNILIRPDGSPVLIDFGAARKDISGTDRSVMAIYSPAYAAPEQIHPIADQGPWTDIYSLGATLYRAVTGELPTNASKRMQKNELVPASVAVKGQYSPPFLKAIDAALAFDPKDRPQSISEWKDRFMPKAEAGSSQTDLSDMPDEEDQRKKIKHMVLALSITLIAIVAAGMWVSRLSDHSTDADQTFHPIIDTARVQEDNKESSESDGAQIPTEKEKDPLVHTNLKINSVPEKAQVFLNGELKGVTPLAAEVSAGMHQIRLSLAGHYDWQSNLIIEEAGDIPIRIPLLRQ